RPVAALLVLVPDDVVRAGDHAGRATGAEPGVDHLGEQLRPLVGPPTLLACEVGGWRRLVAAGVDRWVGDRHGVDGTTTATDPQQAHPGGRVHAAPCGRWEAPSPVLQRAADARSCAAGGGAFWQ